MMLLRSQCSSMCCCLIASLLCIFLVCAPLPISSVAEGDDYQKVLASRPFQESILQIYSSERKVNRQSIVCWS